ncbi:signal peptidase I [Candidatus Woesebacteria bacterium RBG_13_34_9]|uniref:Signal peptidase I n=1 Tax=Candidatus Woesebacteria bacterium RBG_13_34_9 TaxID=1802477 RepID=A0A1F7X0T5_9BACT|nr:MAG: signal peptidase I [Candidatus Woesebacteria bacterium RBG_13_34_9]
MKYSTSDLIIDEAELGYMFSNFIRSLKRRFKIIYLNLLDIDYYYYTVKILQNLPEAFIIIFLGFFAVYNLLKFSESSYGNKFYPIVTSSMTPEITPGSLVYASPSKTYSKGDVVSYVEKTKQGIATGKILTHRIIEKTNDGDFIIKGDANSDPDPIKVNKSQIQGKVKNVIPLLGYIEVLIKTLPGFLILIAVPSFLLILRQVKYMKVYSKAN